MSSPDDIPGPSKPLVQSSPRRSSTDSKSQPSPPTTSHGGRGIANRESPISNRSPLDGHSLDVGPSNLRDRLLVANANGVALDASISEENDTTSSSSPQMNGHRHDDSNESDQQNGVDMNGGPPKSKKKKKKNRRRRKRYISGDSALMGWTGEFPKLTPIANLDNSSDTESQEEEMEMEQPTEIEDDEEQVEPLVVAEDEGSSSVPLVSKSPSSSSSSSSPPPPPLSSPVNKEAITPDTKLEDAKKDIKKTKEDSEPKVPLDKSNKKNEKKNVFGRLAARSKSFCSRPSSDKLTPRLSRFKSQEEEPQKPAVQVATTSKQTKVKTVDVQPTTPGLKLKATDEFYRLPFAYGWKRELVLPSTGNPNRRVGDVFFIAPNGRKLRSREDIAPLLEGELTIEHFCFQRLPQEVGPKFELVRRAMPSSVFRSKSQQTVGQPVTPPVTGKRVSKPKVPKGASPPSEGWTATMAVKGNSRVLASSNGNSSTTGTPNASSSNRKRSFMSKQASSASSGKIVACVYCQGPLNPPGTKQTSAKTNICQRCSKIKRKKQRESEKNEPQPEEEDHDDDHEDEDDESEGSLMEIGEEVEVAGQQPPAEVYNNNRALRRSPKVQEVVVIGGRKAIAIKADPPLRQLKVVPRQPDLTSYERIYNKRKNQSQTVANLVGSAQNSCQVLAAVMKTMNLKERSNMSRVCNTWFMVSKEMSVWRTVSLRDTYVSNWMHLLRKMCRNHTRELDMMGVTMMTPSIRLSSDLRTLRSLRILRTDASTEAFMTLIFRNLPKLKELRATCTSEALSLSNMVKWNDLRVLRLRMTHPKSVIQSINIIERFHNLTELSLRGVSNFEHLDLKIFSHLRKLEVLSLGFCQDMDCNKLGRYVLPMLKSLRSFRLENDHRGMTMFPLDDIMYGISIAGRVKRLELVNVDVNSEFTTFLSNCPSVRELLLTPNCMQNTANMTNAVMQAVSDNAEQLQIFRLGLITQLLSATSALYNGKGRAVIPVQRPVPGIPGDDHLNTCSDDENCTEVDHTDCVAVLPVERLEAILHHMMPHAWLTVVKVDMSETTNMKFLPRPEEYSKNHP
ncbi:uncharacterized protein LOC108109978 isoform X2 [Drosophila eugracilis]|uniref:uncharacterized protein LOC108109978 isoform X2 n=1 Tax=Drosophila eugracilis TaxID=29029 RepID=UPI0007E81040|nr:uncharacterized protein LOC108109978 isoform X2 [Drosophila eugracilis]